MHPSLATPRTEEIGYAYSENGAFEIQCMGRNSWKNHDKEFSYAFKTMRILIGRQGHHVRKPYNGPDSRTAL